MENIFNKFEMNINKFEMRFFNLFKSSRNQSIKQEQHDDLIDIDLKKSIYLYNKSKARNEILYFLKHSKKNIPEVYLSIKEQVLTKMKGVESNLDLEKEESYPDIIFNLNSEEEEIKEDNRPRFAKVEKEDLQKKDSFPYIRFKLKSEEKEIIEYCKPNLDKAKKKDLSKKFKENKKIIKAIELNEQSVYDYLYEYELPKITRLVVKNSGNIESAEDIFQEALLIIYEKIFQNDLKLMCSFSTYLYSISRILWLEKLRSKDKNIVLIDSYDFVEIKLTEIENDDLPDEYERVCKVIEQLGKSCQELLEYFYFQKKNWNEIADLLGYSNAGSAKNQKYKCIEKIKSELAIEK